MVQNTIITLLISLLIILAWVLISILIKNKKEKNINDIDVFHEEIKINKK